MYKHLEKKDFFFTLSSLFQHKEHSKNKLMEKPFGYFAGHLSWRKTNVLIKQMSGGGGGGTASLPPTQPSALWGRQGNPRPLQHRQTLTVSPLMKLSALDTRVLGTLIMWTLAPLPVVGPFIPFPAEAKVDHALVFSFLPILTAAEIWWISDFRNSGSWTVPSLLLHTRKHLYPSKANYFKHLIG